MERINILKTRINGHIFDYNVVGHSNSIDIPKQDEELVDFFAPINETRLLADIDFNEIEKYVIKTKQYVVGDDNIVQDAAYYDFTLYARNDISAKIMEIGFDQHIRDDSDDWTFWDPEYSSIEEKSKLHKEYKVSDKGNDNAKINVEYTHVVKYLLNDYTIGAPSFVEFNGYGYLAWAETDDENFLNVMRIKDLDNDNWEAKHTFHKNDQGFEGKSDQGPFIIGFNDKLFLFWKGKDNYIYFTYSSNGKDWGPILSVLTEQTLFSPSLTIADDKLFIAWTGLDHRINLRWSDNGINWKIENKILFPDKYEKQFTFYSSDGPSVSLKKHNEVYSDVLIAYPNYEDYSIRYVIVDGHSPSLNTAKEFYRSSKDKEQCLFSPSIFRVSEVCFLGWIGTDENHCLNIDRLASEYDENPPYSNFSKTTYRNDSSNKPPCVSSFQNLPILLWAGDNGQINILTHV